MTRSAANGVSIFSKEKAGPFDRRSGRARTANETRSWSVRSHMHGHWGDHWDWNFRARGYFGGGRATGGIQLENAEPEFQPSMDEPFAACLWPTRYVVS